MGEKTRVFHLAKQIGVTSKELVVALNELGLVKVAQSTLTKAEVEQLLDALSTPSASSVDSAGESEEKIRQRVRKDVENEIHQIEEKVDATLGSEDSADEDIDFVTAIVEADGEPTEPEITPAPETGGAFVHTPVFKAPDRPQRRRASRKADGPKDAEQEGVDKQTSDEVEAIEEPKGIQGSVRLEAQRRRRTERREEGRKRNRIVSQAEFLARRESVERTMVVRERDRHDGPGRITQVGVLEDGLLVEHFVTSEHNASMIGNIYLGRVQNVLPSMEAAFIDIGQGRNGVLYAGEVDWKAAGLGGRSRRIEQALKSGDQVVVQVSKDPVGHKGARLTTQISLAGRYLVYVPGGRSAGISRKLPAPERKRLKEILTKVVPGKGGTIIRTAAEGVPEEAIAADVNRLHTQWESIQEQAEKEKRSKGAKPVTLYEEPNMLVKVVRDLFNDDFTSLVVDGKRPWNVVHAYISSVAPDLEDRLVRYDASEHDGQDAFHTYRVDEQIQKALSRTVWLPSGGTLIIEKTEAMTVIDVNTGKFTGSGGSLEETVTRNNLEAAEEIVRQMRLRDIGGMIIVDFIDMILPENQELVLRRLKEALGRDRTRHQVSEVTSLGLVQMTRKRLGTGLLETFSTPCQCCEGRGLILSDDPVEAEQPEERGKASRRSPGRKPESHPAAEVMRNRKEESSRDIALDEQALEELANSVIGEETGTGAGAESGSDRQRPSGGRRRGRRGAGRGRGGVSEDNVADKPAEVTSEKTFEQAKAEFDASPRRKRRTRGNSRSDHAPTPEDFTTAPEQKPEQKPEQEQADAAREGVAPPRNGRGRRRAVRRRTSNPQPEPQQPVKKPVVEKETPQTDEPKRGGRGRRRATRRRTS
ncbi:translation initiation factor IF-2 N-terminal domain-containing protein [Corynebacterium mayonis]|uniref:translation initiation factor IF-2 N-terminal domain-containing protein n=1 Tax=Corynebacterium mayonis TaxID=3062461 RepID=UPI003CC7E4DC